MTDVKDALLAKLREARSAVVATLDGLDEYDVRRPMTPSGTNLLGLVKHLVGNEHVYLGESFGRTPPDVLPWVADGSIAGGTGRYAGATGTIHFEGFSNTSTCQPLEQDFVCGFTEATAIELVLP